MTRSEAKAGALPRAAEQSRSSADALDSDGLAAAIAGAKPDAVDPPPDQPPGQRSTRCAPSRRLPPTTGCAPRAGPTSSPRLATRACGGSWPRASPSSTRPRGRRSRARTTRCSSRGRAPFDRSVEAADRARERGDGDARGSRASSCASASGTAPGTAYAPRRQHGSPSVASAASSRSSATAAGCSRSSTSTTSSGRPSPRSTRRRASTTSPTTTRRRRANGCPPTPRRSARQRPGGVPTSWLARIVAGPLRRSI